jgi:hypothetical protein
MTASSTSLCAPGSSGHQIAALSWLLVAGKAIRISSFCPSEGN